MHLFRVSETFSVQRSVGFESPLVQRQVQKGLSHSEYKRVRVESKSKRVRVKSESNSLNQYLKKERKKKT